MPTKVLVDTNFLLDLMVPDRVNSTASIHLVDEFNEGKLSIALHAGSLNDAYYIARNFCTEAGRRGWLEFFLDRFDVFPVDTALCRASLDSDEPDFEDGLVRACAEALDVDYIVSTDRKAFKRSYIRRIESPELARLFGHYDN